MFIALAMLIMGIVTYAGDDRIDQLNVVVALVSQQRLCRVPLDQGFGLRAIVTLASR
jgi:hypothetical protein